jgi:hypothetical protein
MEYNHGNGAEAQPAHTIVAEMCGIKAALERCVACVDIELGFASEIRGMETAVEAFLLKHCQHVVVHDYVDITPDRGQYISYCNVCLCTLTSRQIAAASVHQPALRCGET